MTDIVQFYKCLLLKDIKNINKLNYKKLKKVNDSILLKNQKTIKHKHLLKWEDHYSESSNEVSRKMLFEIRRSIK